MKKLLLSLAVAVLMVSPAFAAVQNVKVSGNITSTYLNRSDFNFEKGSGATGGLEFRQSLFLTQTTLRVDADLSDNVSTTVGFINEREWGGENNPSSLNTATAQPTEVDLYLAYVTLREFLYSPLTLNVGRQAFAFGNSLVFDATGTNNAAAGRLRNVAQDLTKRSSLDAIRATFDYKPLTVDLFWGKSSQGNVGGNGTQKDDSDVYGINANYQVGDAMNTVVEGYVFARTNGSGSVGTAADRADKLWVPGLRASTNPIKGLNVQVEGALQRGTLSSAVTSSNQKRNAFAFQGLVSYALPVAQLEKYKPTVSGSYTYVSGDKTTTASGNKKTSAWDPFMENQNGGTIFNSIFNLTNMQIVNATISASPLADVTTSLSWNGLWAAQSYAVGSAGITTTSLVQPDSSSFTPQVTSNKELGNEFDANVAYQYTEDVKFGLNLGWFVPGRAFTSLNHESAKQAIASVGVNF